MVLVFGMTVIGCDNGSTNSNGGENDGIFTLTDIPLQYEGKYALFQTDVDSNPKEIISGINYNQSSGTTSFCLISHGKVDFPMWIQTFSETEVSLKKYSGSNTVEAVVAIFNNTSYEPYMSPILTISFKSISFLNGNATKSWNDGETKIQD